eukprot:10936756-Karenia_brevis.AAC.1
MPLWASPPAASPPLWSKECRKRLQNDGFWDHLGSKLGSLGLKLRGLDSMKHLEAILAPSW